MRSRVDPAADGHRDVALVPLVATVADLVQVELALDNRIRTVGACSAPFSKKPAQVTSCSWPLSWHEKTCVSWS